MATELFIIRTQLAGSCESSNRCWGHLGDNLHGDENAAEYLLISAAQSKTEELHQGHCGSFTVDSWAATAARGDSERQTLSLHPSEPLNQVLGVRLVITVWTHLLFVMQVQIWEAPSHVGTISSAFKVGLIYLFTVCVHVCTCHSTSVKVGEQHGGASSLLTKHGSQGWNSGCQVWLVSMHT